MKKYICPECGKIVTDQDIKNELSIGGPGMCMCKYYDRDVITPASPDNRLLTEYVEYDKYYEGEKNVIRAPRENSISKLRDKLFPDFGGEKKKEKKC